jgi:hypothetical protein
MESESNRPNACTMHIYVFNYLVEFQLESFSLHFDTSVKYEFQGKTLLLLVSLYTYIHTLKLLVKKCNRYFKKQTAAFSAKT